MTDRFSNAQHRDGAALLHPYTNAVAHQQQGAHMIARGEGVRVFDAAGRPFIEAMSGLWCAGLGFNNEELVEAATTQMRALSYYHLFTHKSHEPAVALAEKIKELAPGDMARVFYQSSGSEANDTQVKMAWYYNNALGRPEKKKILSRRRGYHGVTLFAASLTGLPYNHLDFDLPLARVHHLATPHFWREGQGMDEAAFVAHLLRDLEETIAQEGPETIAAFIAEPVMGAGGVIVPPEGYFPAVMDILEQHDILCISDEVICGFGRTGEWFGAERFGMRPTSISMAKQLTAAVTPLSAVAINREMAEVIEGHSGKIGTFGHGYTYGGHPVGCAVGLKALEIYERMDAPGRVRALEPIFAAHLAQIAAHPLVGEVRHAGLMGAVELSPDGTPTPFASPGKVGLRAAAEMMERGVICRAIGDALAFCPPMIISEEDLALIFAPLEAALDATLLWARGEGLMT